MRRTARAGFTLLELMIVIVIIGILAAILIPNFIKAKYKAHLANCQSNIRTIATAAELYRTDNNAYPPSGAVAPGNPIFDLSFINPDAVKCPSNGSNYTLEVMDEHYTVVCNGLHHLLLSVSPGYPQFSPTRGQMLNP